MAVDVRRLITWRTVAAAVLVAAIAGGAAGHILAAGEQSAPAANGSDVLPALLTEVRGLRAAMEQMASAGPRIQLFVARLQLEETRINNMARRLDGIRDEIAAVQRQVDNGTEQQQHLETNLNQQLSDAARQQFTGMLADVKHELADHRKTLARLTAEEAQLAQDVGAEQARWTSINAQLDELERVLAKR